MRHNHSTWYSIHSTGPRLEPRILSDSSPCPAYEHHRFSIQTKGKSTLNQPINLYMMPGSHALVLVNNIYPIISYHIISFHFQPKTPVHSIRGQRQLHHWGLLGEDIQINDTDPRQQTVISYHVLDPLNRTSESLEYCPTAPHAPPTSNNNLLKR